MTEGDLKRLERATFRAAADSGLWDMFLAAVISMLAIAPLLSSRLGDFWSSAVFLPFYAVALLAIRTVQARIVRPRVGVVELAPSRKRRLGYLATIMLVVNVLALGLGIVAAIRGPTGQTDLVPLTLSLTLLLGFSTAAFFLEIPRVFAYGVLLAAAPPLGEALFQRGLASHHGFPVVFGVSAVVILGSGIIRFLRFLPRPRREGDGPSREESHA